MTKASPAPLSRRAPEERRDRILKAALELFARDGFDDTNIADVAREAGVAVGTVYLSFPDKPSLLIGVVNSCKAVTAGLINEQRKTASGSLAERLRSLIEAIVDLMLSGPPMAIALDRQKLAALGPDAVKAFAAVDEAIALYINDLVAAGLARDVERKAAATLASGLVTSAVEACRRGSVEKSHIIDELVDVLTRWWSP